MSGKGHCRRPSNPDAGAGVLEQLCEVRKREIPRGFWLHFDEPEMPERIIKVSVMKTSQNGLTQRKGHQTSGQSGRHGAKADWRLRLRYGALRRNRRKPVAAFGWPMKSWSRIECRRRSEPLQGGASIM